MFPQFELLNDTTRTERKKEFEIWFGLFKGDLLKEKVVRVLVASAPGYGHQASTIFLVRRLVENPYGSWQGFDYRGTVEIYYDDVDEKDPTLPKIHALLPELKGKNEGSLPGCQATLKIFDLGKEPPKEWVRWGFCGGYDAVRVNPNEDVKARLFILTQPFKFSVRDQSIAPGNLFYYTENAGTKSQKTHVGSFDKLPALMPYLIGERAYGLGIQPLTEDDWKYFQSTDYPENTRKLVAALEKLTDPETLKKITLVPVYGINCPGATIFADPIAHRIVLEMAAVRTALEGTKEPFKPPVILNFGDYRPGTNVTTGFKHIQGLLAGGQTACEQGAQLLAKTELATDLARALARKLNVAWKNRAKSLPEASDRYLLCDYLKDRVSVDELLKWVTKEPKRVLFIQLGFVPPPVFNHVLASAGLPTLFEGCNTAVITLNTGKPYLQTNARAYAGRIRYPVGYLGEVNCTEPLGVLQGIADSIQFDFEEWPSQVSTAPTRGMADFFKAIQNPKSQYDVYFKSIQVYYQQQHNDKFNLSAALVYPWFKTLKISEKAAAGASVLDELYKTLQEEIEQHEATVSLLSDVFKDGGIHDFYSLLLQTIGRGLVITSAKLGCDKDGEGTIERVTLDGDTDAFGVGTKASLEFTAPFGAIESKGKYTGSLPWNLDQVPWIVFDDPFVRVLASNGTYPPSSAVGGRIKGTDLDLSMEFPIEDDRIVVRGEFESLKKLSDCMALVGGIDLSNSVPAELLPLGIGVRYLEFTFDAKNKKVDYIALRVETDKPWGFHDRLSLEDVTLTIRVINPVSLRTRHVDASFTGMVRIGSGDDAPRIAVGAQVPKLALRGQLFDPTLPINKALEIFWPGVSPPWPGGKEPEITRLSFEYEMEGKSYNVDLALKLDWPITIGSVTPLTIESIALRLQGGEAEKTGSLSGSFTVCPDDPDIDIGLMLAAAYLGTGKGWRFQAQQTSKALKISKLIDKYLGWEIESAFDVDISGLSLMVETAGPSFKFSAETEQAWKLPFLDEATVKGKALVGYGAKPKDPSDPLEDPKPGYYGEISADIKWHEVDLALTGSFQENEKTKKYEMAFSATCGILKGTIEKSKEGDWVGSLGTTEGTTLGSIIETMVSWATGSKFGLSAPWNVLDKIPLSNLSVGFNFTKKTVSLDVKIGPIKLGFVTIEKISVVYQPEKTKERDKGVWVDVDAEFIWGEKVPAWDATKPESTPAPPAGGNKLLDLRLLALGQHVTVDGLTESETVQAAVGCMENMEPPKAGEIPKVKFDAESSWLIGADFGILRQDGGNSNGAEE